MGLKIPFLEALNHTNYPSQKIKLTADEFQIEYAEDNCWQNNLRKKEH